MTTKLRWSSWFLCVRTQAPRSPDQPKRQSTTQYSGPISPDLWVLFPRNQAKSKRREICSRSRLVRSLVGFQSRRLRLSARRRLCNTVGARFIDGSARRCCAISAARSRAAARTNLARSNQSLFLRSRFGGAKRSAPVNIFIFMICPRLVGSCLADDKQILPRDGGHLMAIKPSNHAAGDPRSQKRVPIRRQASDSEGKPPPSPGAYRFAPDPISIFKKEKSRENIFCLIKCSFRLSPGRPAMGPA
jgi:hypothetical protein